MKHNLSVSCCAVALWRAMLLDGGSATAQTCGAGTPAIYNETFQIERQVDANRYVERAVYSNNRLGDYILEFMATRTDIPNTHERWTVTFEEDATFDHHEHIDIDGNWIYSIKSRLVGGDRHVTIAVPGASVEVNVEDISSDPHYDDFVALIVQTESHREVLSSVREEMPPEPLPTDPCGCGPAPDCSDGLPPFPWCQGDCVDPFACCMQWEDQLECTGACSCNALPPGEVGDCCADLAGRRARGRQICLDGFLNCLSGASPCPPPQQ